MTHPIERLLVPPPDEDSMLPFVTTVEEADVLKVVQETKDTLTAEHVRMIRQWMKFSRGLDDREDKTATRKKNEQHRLLHSMLEFQK